MNVESLGSRADALVTHRWWIPALLVLGAFALQVIAFGSVLRDYFPTADDVALAAVSTDAGGPAAPRSWVVDGFHNYFNSDQEWPWVKPTTNFLRPAGNALYWLCYRLVGRHWSVQLLLGYLVHALTVGLVFYLAFTVLQVPLSSALAATAIALFNPAYLSTYLNQYILPWEVQFPVYQFEVIAAFLSVLAALCFLKQEQARFGLLTTLAVFFKETALTVPLSALVQVGAWRSTHSGRLARNAAFLLLPLAAWMAVRLLVYRYSGPVYVLSSGGPSVTRVLRNALLLPTGLYEAPARSTLDALHHHHWGVVLAHALAILVNVGTWIVIAAVIARAVRQEGRQWLTRAPSPWLTLLIFAAGNLGLLCILELTDLRYGYLWFALGPAALLAGMSGWKQRNALAWTAAGIVMLTQIASLAEAFSPDSIAGYQLTKRAALQLNGLLHGLPPSTRTVYLLDDIFMRDTSPEFTAKLASFDGRIVRVNNILPRGQCRSAADDADHYQLRAQGNVTTLSYSEPACLYRPDKAIEVPLGTIGPDGILKRGPWITYHFPEVAIEEVPFGNRLHYVYGKHWEAQFSDPQCQKSPVACIWIGLDPLKQIYYRISVP